MSASAFLGSLQSIFGLSFLDIMGALRNRTCVEVLQHSITLTARPPSEVSLYRDCMSRPVSYIVLIT
jgi:hypothetical protein